MSGQSTGGATLPQSNVSTPEAPSQLVQENSQVVTGREIVPVKPQASEEQINEFAGQPPTLEHMASTKVEEVSNDDKSIPVEEVTGEIVDSSSPQNASRTSQQAESHELQDKKPVFSAEDITNAESFITKEFAPNTEEEAVQFNLMYQRVLQDAQGSLTSQEAYKKAMAMHYLALAHDAIRNSPHLFNIQPHALAQILYKADLDTHQLQQQHSKFNAPPASSVHVEEPVFKQPNDSGPYPKESLQEDTIDNQLLPTPEDIQHAVDTEIDTIADIQHLTTEQKKLLKEEIQKYALEFVKFMKSHPKEGNNILSIARQLVLKRQVEIRAQSNGQNITPEEQAEIATLQQELQETINKVRPSTKEEAEFLQKLGGIMQNKEMEEAIARELRKDKSKSILQIIIAIAAAVGLQLIGGIGPMTGVPVQ